MFKTISTAPYLAALLMSNSIGLELVSQPDESLIEETSSQSSCRSRCVSSTASMRLRKISDAAANLYESIGNTYRDKSRPHSQDLAQEQGFGVSDDVFRPVFKHTDKSTIIRRLYPAKNRGRTCLAPVQKESASMGLGHSRASSTTSAAESVKESPQRSNHNSPFRRRSMHEEMSDDATGQIYTKDRGPTSLSDDIEDRLARCVQVSEDTTYGTMDREEPNVGMSGHPHEQDDERGDLPVIIDRPVEWTPAKRKEDAVTSTMGQRGHARNESVCSIWTVASSPEESSTEDHAPVQNKRKPLQLQSRPPMPNFSLSAATQQAAAAATKSSTTTSTTRTAWESWDEDFRGAAASIAVPCSIRDSQSSLRTHLAKLRRFSSAVDQLSLLKTQLADKDDDDEDDEEKEGVREQVDALLAIASSEGGHSADELVTALLDGRTGKVTLDDALLDNLIQRSESLIQVLKE